MNNRHRQVGSPLTTSDFAMLAKAGIAKNDVPPPIAHVENLPKAIQRALSAAREDDLIVALTNQVQTVYRTLARHRVAEHPPGK